MAKQNKLNIWMNGIYIGFWQRRLGVEELHYDQAWVDSEQGRPLSLSLPFTPGNQKHRGDKVTFYFDNLLPDSTQIRERLAQKFSTKSVSPFDLLVELGRDCVGAIQLLAVDEIPDVKGILFKPLLENEVASILRHSSAVMPLGFEDKNDELRLSLAGAQEKTALLWHEGKWCLPIGATPTTHIFKLPLGLVGNMKADMHNSVENEWLCSKIVAAFGLPVAHCEMAKFEDQKVLIVERFDRKLAIDKSWIIRLPQEDMCQAKGISPLRKYQSDGGLGVTDCMRILDGASDSRRDKQIFFKAQIIFYLLMATDGHSKNFSIFHQSKNQYELTPLYDILSAHPIVGTKSDQIPIQKAKMAMAIKGSKNYYHIQQIQRRHFVHHATDVGISENEADKLITEIIDATESVSQKVYQLLPETYPRELADKILQGMLKQSQKLVI